MLFRSTVATLVVPLLHTPLASPSLVNVLVNPIQIGLTPLTIPAFAFGLTVTVLVAVKFVPQPVTVYVITDIPALTPVTTPEAASTVATLVVPLLHTPLASPLLVNVLVNPIQIGLTPLTIPAFAFGLITNVNGVNTDSQFVALFT